MGDGGALAADAALLQPVHLDFLSPTGTSLILHTWSTAKVTAG